MKEEGIERAELLCERSGVDDTGAEEAHGEWVIAGEFGVIEEMRSGVGLCAIGTNEKGACCGGQVGEMGRYGARIWMLDGGQGLGPLF